MTVLQGYVLVLPQQKDRVEAACSNICAGRGICFGGRLREIRTDVIQPSVIRLRQGASAVEDMPLQSQS